MNREVHVRFCERLELKCSCLLDYALTYTLAPLDFVCRVLSEANSAVIKVLTAAFSLGAGGN